MKEDKTLTVPLAAIYAWIFIHETLIQEMLSLSMQSTINSEPYIFIDFAGMMSLNEQSRTCQEKDAKKNSKLL